MHFPSAIGVFSSILAVLAVLPLTHCIPTQAKPSPSASSTSRPEGLSDAAQVAHPIAAAWMYLSDDTNYKTIPHQWSKIDFKTVDLLYIGPVGIQPDGTFNLYNGTHGSLAKRFQWTIQKARSQNPDIKIIASQFWGGNPGGWGDDLSTLQNSQAIEKYATSVQAFMKKHTHVDGYDVDYEDKNVRQNIGDILKQIRKKLDQISGQRKYYVTISPSETTYLKAAVPALDYVNMQNYEGGIALTTKDFLDLGLKPKQLLYGLDAERPEDGHSIQETEKEFKDGGLAGIHVWRLDSSDLEAEGDRQRQIAKFLHQGSSEN